MEEFNLVSRHQNRSPAAPASAVNANFVQSVRIVDERDRARQSFQGRRPDDAHLGADRHASACGFAHIIRLPHGAQPLPRRAFALPNAPAVLLHRRCSAVCTTTGQEPRAVRRAGRAGCGPDRPQAAWPVLVQVDVDYSRTRASRRRPPGASPRADARSPLRVAIAISATRRSGRRDTSRATSDSSGSRRQPIASRNRSRRYARTIRELDRYRRLGGDDESAADPRCFASTPRWRPCFQAASPTSSEIQTHFEQACKAWYAAGL